MKQYVKDGKIYNTPISIIDRNQKIFTNNDEVIKRYGYEDYVPSKQPLEILIQKSNNQINEETDEKILNNFTWSGEEFYLTMENQINFSNMFIAKDFLTFPQQVKTKSGFITLNSKEELTEFYLAGVNFIRECLEEGWNKKSSTEKEIRKNY